MGLKYLHYIVQMVMENLLAGIDDADMYIDDVGVFTVMSDKHVELIFTILQCLHDNVFRINPLKCEWAVKETKLPLMV